MWGLFAGAVAAVLAPIGPGALVPLKLAIASADSVGSDVYVAVVVNFGDGSSMSTVSKCVPVASNAHDADALAAAVGPSNVAYSGSGLLCAIDNYPANGVQNCGQSVGNGNYNYWSYWHGASGSWVYASNGPAEQSVSSPADDVEGLMFQSDEPANSSDPPPSVAPLSYAQICNASTEVPPAQAGGPTTTTTAETPAASSVTPTTAKATPGPDPATTSTLATSAGSKSSSPSATSGTTASGGTTPTTLASSGSNGARGGSHGPSGVQRAVSATPASKTRSGGAASSNLLSAVLIAVVVAGLGGFALFRWRRRPAEE